MLDHWFYTIWFSNINFWSCKFPSKHYPYFVPYSHFDTFFFPIVVQVKLFSYFSSIFFSSNHGLFRIMLYILKKYLEYFIDFFSYRFLFQSCCFTLTSICVFLIISKFSESFKSLQKVDVVNNAAVNIFMYVCDYFCLHCLLETYYQKWNYGLTGYAIFKMVFSF